MDSQYDDLLYERLPTPALDEAWLAFYAARTRWELAGRQGVAELLMLRARNRLVLHYAPIVKYVVYRKFALSRNAEPPAMFAASLLAVIAGMMRRPDGLDDWTRTCIELTSDACDRFGGSTAAPHERSE